MISKNKMFKIFKKRPTSYENASQHYANCLDAEGVDNWSWYMTNKEEYLGNFESFEDKAKDDLKYYTKIEV